MSQVINPLSTFRISTAPKTEDSKGDCIAKNQVYFGSLLPMARKFGLSNYIDIVPATVSAASSFSVCLTYLIFPELRSLRYVELVFYIAINDLIASIGMSLGNSENGSASCWFQGISTNFNYLSAIFWTTIITFQVWLVVCKQNVIKDLTYAHLICWGIPLLATLLPLTTSTYANPDDEANWCFVSTTSDSPDWAELFWFIFAFYGWVWLAMIFNVALISGVLYRFYQMQDVPERVVGTIRKLLLYPIIISICWALTTFLDLSSAVNAELSSSSFYIADGIATILALSQGFFFAVVFFGLNPIIRKAWADLFKSMGILSPSKKEESQDMFISLVTISKNQTASKDGRSTGQDAEQTASAARPSSAGFSRPSSVGGFMRPSSGGFMHDSQRHISGNSWDLRPKESTHVQEEFDYIPTDELSQRSSVFAYMTRSRLRSSTADSTFVAAPAICHEAPAVASAARSLHGNMELAQTINPLVAVSVAVDDFASVTTAPTVTGRNTPHSQDQNDGGNETGITPGPATSSEREHQPHTSDSLEASRILDEEIL